MAAAELERCGTAGATLPHTTCVPAELAGHSRAQQLVAQLDSTSKSSSSTVTSEGSEAE